MYRGALSTVGTNCKQSKSLLTVELLNKPFNQWNVIHKWEWTNQSYMNKWMNTQCLGWGITCKKYMLHDCIYIKCGGTSCVVYVTGRKHKRALWYWNYSPSWSGCWVVRCVHFAKMYQAVPLRFVHSSRCMLYFNKAYFFKVALEPPLLVCTPWKNSTDRFLRIIREK